MISAKVIADSISPDGKRITTMEVTFNRYILAEFNTHRVFSRNFSSSRAIPTRKLLEQVRTHPAMPVHWGKNQAGMQANEELTGEELVMAQRQWVIAAGDAADRAERMAEFGAHKQIVNRIIEPYLYVTGIVTSTEWDNFFELRCHPDAQPEFQELACKMRDAREASTPEQISLQQWHLPYLTEDEKNNADMSPVQSLFWAKVSAARCCRVSYLKHDGTAPSIEEDIALFDRLAAARPIHASPLEHQAKPLWFYTDTHLQGNFRKWIQYRQVYEATAFVS